MRINPNNSILHALTCIFDVIVVTLLFLICCLPVFTVGASAAAMYATMIAIVNDNCTSVVRSFFGAFRNKVAKGDHLRTCCLFFQCRHMLAVGNAAATDYTYSYDIHKFNLQNVMCITHYFNYNYFFV